MSTYVAECEALVGEALPALCSNGAFSVSVEEIPRRILEDYGNLPVGLYAQSLCGRAILVNLMMPEVRRFLKRLAGSGVGPSEDYNGVRYRFMECKYCVLPPVPVSNDILTQPPQLQIPLPPQQHQFLACDKKFSETTKM